jgi:hypothetical protein
MRMALIIAGSLSLFLVSCLQGQPGKDVHPEAASLDRLDCPKSMNPLPAWLDKELAAFKEARYQTGGAWMYAQLKKCKTPDGQALEILPELTNILRFTKIMDQGIREKHMMKLAVTDEEYIAAAPPGLLDLPEDLKTQEFLQALDRNLEDGGAEALAYVDRVNEGKPESMKYKRFIFDSQFLSTPDFSKSMTRFFVHVPGDDFDRFLQFGLRDDRNKVQASSVSVVSIQKRDLQTHQKLEKPQAWYHDWFRKRTTEGVVFSTRLKETNSLESCYGCHSAALLPIYPEASTFDALQFQVELAAVNEVVRSFSNAEPAMVNRQDFGPALGPVDYPGRTPEFFQQCAGDLMSHPTSIQKVAQAMNCSSCHNDVYRPALRSPMASLSQIPRDSIVKVLVTEQKSMPPSADLSDAERDAVVKCLNFEYFAFGSAEQGLMDKWLRNTK